MAVKIGYKAAAEQFGPRDLIEAIVLAERLGFDEAFISDHFHPWRPSSGHAPHALTCLAAACERTTRITLGTSVLTPTIRYHPSVVAQSFATLGSLYPDRVILGLGTGEAINDVSATGTPWPGFSERLARLAEAVNLIRRLWTGNEVTASNGFYHTTGARLYDVPRTPIPIWIAAGGPTTAKWVGRVADGLICTSGKGAAFYHDRLVPAFDEGREQSAHPEREPARMMEIKLSYDPDERRARRALRFWAPLSLTTCTKVNDTDPASIERASNELDDADVAGRWIVSNDPDEVVERIAPYRRLGFDHIVLHSPAVDQRRFIRDAAETLVPRLRAQ